MLENGTLEVLALGGAQPISFGVCPVDILGDEHILPGVLSYGSMHNSGRTSNGRDVLAGNVQWKDVYIVTRKSSQNSRSLVFGLVLESCSVSTGVSPSRCMTVLPLTSSTTELR